VVALLVAVGYPPLGLNLVSDAIALWFGLFIVERALDQGRRAARKPAHQAMVDDLARLRLQVHRILFVMLIDTATESDFPVMRAAATRDGDVAEILARRRLTTSPAPMRLLGILSGPQLTWQQVIWAVLSPQALRLETLVSRYMTVADAPTLAALQAFEAAVFTQVIEGRLVFDDDVILEIFWRSMIQCLSDLDDEIAIALTRHDDRAVSTGPASYVLSALEHIQARDLAAASTHA
jgi:hypothetical protein